MLFDIKNKTPGNNLISMELYQTFSNLFGKYVVKAINHLIVNAKLAALEKQAVITLLEQDKDRTLINNWRPIFLLNVD